VTAVDVPLPTLPADPELAVTCHCGAPRSAHAGRKHLGHCREHAVVLSVDPVPDGSTSVGVRILPCPDGCRRFWPARGERLRLRALAAFEEDLMVPIAEADKARPRSRKTEEARAAGQFGVGPSDIGSCRKRIEYRERPPEDFEPIDVDHASAYEGTLLHDGITRARRMRYPWRRFGVVIHVPGLDRPGEGDEVDPILGVVVDYKTAGSWKWDNVGDYGPPESEWDQVFTYGLGLENDGQPVEWCELHYYNREHFRNPERFRRPYSRARALAAVQRLHAILDDLEAGRELPRDESGPSTSSICRNWCEAVLHCWNVKEAELNRRSPESWMHVHNDADVEEAIRRYLQAHDTLVSPGNDEKERQKVLLDGIEYGRYGDFTWQESGGKESWVDDRIARAEQLEAEMHTARQEGRPPTDPDVLPVPQRKKVTPIQRRPGRVRKAILEKEAREAAKAAAAEEQTG
jgi:hypothetical protein